MDLKRAHLNAVIAGMVDVTKKGTAARSSATPPYSVAGKTGTAQVVTIAQDTRYDEKKLRREHHDHALFIAFAPAEKPRIAIAVLVENGGFGAKAAAPVAKTAIDYWLTGENALGLLPRRAWRCPPTVRAPPSLRRPPPVPRPEPPPRRRRTPHGNGSTSRCSFAGSSSG